MSSIKFHSPSGMVEVSGRERAYAGTLCHEMLCATLGINGNFTESERYRRLLHPDCYVLRERDNHLFFDRLRTWIFAGFGAMFLLPDGRQTNVFECSLNTAVAMGSDPIRLLAKLHGQCEIHAYVEGSNRAWLANIIEQGVKDKILRLWPDVAYGGWNAVVELLRSRDDEPVVTSYSVCDSFPNKYVAQEYGEWVPEPDDPEGDAWYDLPHAERWRLAMDGLRKYNVTGTVEMKPETFAVQGYGDGLSGFDVVAMLFEEVKE